MPLYHFHIVEQQGIDGSSWVECRDLPTAERMAVHIAAAIIAHEPGFAIDQGGLSVEIMNEHEALVAQLKLNVQWA